MPMKAKRPCRWPGCPNLTSDRRGYCDEHKTKAAQKYERYGRDPATAKRYGADWKKIRKRYITAHPLCEICKAAGRYTAAEEVHHKTPLADGGTNDPDNLQALCKPCHSRITAKNSSWGR